MKNLLIAIIMASLLCLWGCSSNSEDPGVDCTQTDLDVSVASTVEPTCQVAGSITVEASGGSSPYTYSLDGTNFQSATQFTNLSAGSLTVTVKDADDCTAILNTTLNSDGGISLSTATTNSDCLEPSGSIEVVATNGDGNYTYSLDGGGTQTTNTFSDVASGTHEVEVIDGTGCSASSEVYVSSNISLENDIMPLLLAQCTFSGCHNGDNGADRNWTEKEDVLDKALRIKERTQNGEMPRSPGVLTQDQIDIIACWVDDGAQNN